MPCSELNPLILLACLYAHCLLVSGDLAKETLSGGAEGLLLA